MKIQVGRRPGFMIPTSAASKQLRDSKGGIMYARVTTLPFQVDKYDEGVRIFKESVLPAARAQKGFRGALLLGDRKAGRGLALTFWDDEAAAVANEENLYYQEQLIKFLPNFTSDPIREGFEVEVEAR
jgi:heme-degrading monooxygenase HmoA